MRVTDFKIGIAAFPAIVVALAALTGQFGGSAFQRGAAALLILAAFGDMLNLTFNGSPGRFVATVVMIASLVYFVVAIIASVVMLDGMN